MKTAFIKIVIKNVADDGIEQFYNKIKELTKESYPMDNSVSLETAVVFK